MNFQSFFWIIPVSGFTEYRELSWSNKTIQNYLEILQETGLITLLAMNKAGSSILKQTEKIYLDNPDLYNSITNEIGFESQIGTIREIFFINMIKNSDRERALNDQDQQ